MTGRRCSASARPGSSSVGRPYTVFACRCAPTAPAFRPSNRRVCRIPVARQERRSSRKPPPRRRGRAAPMPRAGSRAGVRSRRALLGAVAAVAAAGWPWRRRAGRCGVEPGVCLLGAPAPLDEGGEAYRLADDPLGMVNAGRQRRRGRRHGAAARRHLPHPIRRRRPVRRQRARSVEDAGVGGRRADAGGRRPGGVFREWSPIVRRRPHRRQGALGDPAPADRRFPHADAETLRRRPGSALPGPVGRSPAGPASPPRRRDPADEPRPTPRESANDPGRAQAVGRSGPDRAAAVHG